MKARNKVLILGWLIILATNLVYSQNNTAWRIQEIEKGEISGIDILVDDNNNLHISYINDNGDIIYATKEGGNNWKKERIDKAESQDWSGYTRIKKDNKGILHIIYFIAYGNPRYSIKHAFKMPNKGWKVEIVDQDIGINGGGNGIGFDIDKFGNLYISYCFFYERIKYGVKFAFYSGNKWNIQKIFENGQSETVDLMVDEKYVHIVFKHEMERNASEIIYGYKEIYKGEFVFSTVVSHNADSITKWMSNPSLAIYKNNIYIPYTYNHNLKIAYRNFIDQVWENVDIDKYGDFNDIIIKDGNISISYCGKGLLLATSSTNNFKWKYETIVSDLGMPGRLIKTSIYSNKNRYILFYNNDLNSLFIAYK